MDNYVVPGHTDKLDLFQNLPTDTSIESVEWIEYRPTSGQIRNGWMIEFNVPGNSSHYLDLKESRLKTS